MNVLAFVILFGVLVFFHELGHFLAAKALGVRVLRFSIGFGPRLLGFERAGTEYWIAAIPLGGYVKMAGQDPTAEVAPEDVGRGFYDQAPPRRLLISVAGPVFNLVLAFVIYAGVFASMKGTSEIGTVMPHSPADVAGLRPGDRILSVAAPGEAARPVRYFLELRELVSPHPGQPLVLEVERDGQRLPPLTIRPATGSDEDPLGDTVHRGLIGVSPIYPSAQVAPVRPGAAGPVEPLDVVVQVAGKPVRNGVEVMRAVAGASCAPVDLEVLRPAPGAKSGAAAATDRLALRGVPTCAEGKATLQLADPSLLAVIGSVRAGGPASAAGLRRGDVIAAVDGKPVHGYGDLEALAGSGEFKPGTPVLLRLADGRDLRLVPGVQKEGAEAGSRRAVPDLGFDYSYAGVDRRALWPPEAPIHLGVVDLAGKSWASLVDAIQLVVTAVARLVTLRLSTDNLAGPVGLFRLTSVVIEQGGWEAFIGLLAAVSVNVGLLNLLPIPILDGGNIGQALVELVMRRGLSLRTRAITNVVGLVLLVSIFSLVFWKDIAREVRLRAERPAVQSAERNGP